MKKNHLTLLLVLLTKSTKLVKVYKLLKLMKFTKAFMTFASMIVSAFVYAIFLGPWFAIGLITMLFIHEMGHIIALKIKGYDAPGPVFIPMLGAVIFAPRFENPEDEAFIGYGGPLVGGLAALILFGIWALMPEPSEILLMTSYIAAYLNLFNLIPIRPLDGGRITQVVGPWFKYVGLVFLLAFSLYVRQPSILLIWILVVDDINLTPWLKFGVGATCQAAMMILMFSGYGDQPLWVNVLDSCLATMFTFRFYATARKLVSDEVEKVVEVALNIRIKWTILYLVLVICLTMLMIYQIPYLPQAVTKN
ncbi:MAG: hypothetical protein Q8Q89_00155 [bacterium]|nr:hypothetical protein [bacterium]